MTSRIKVYELAKEIGVDSQNLVDVVQRLGIDIKNTMSILGTEEVRTVRDYYKKNKVFTKAASTPKAAAPSASGGKTTVTEKRVGATLIRRRAAPKAPVEEVAVEPVEETPVLEETESEELVLETTATEDVQETEAQTQEVSAEEAVEETAAAAAPQAEKETPEEKAKPRKFFPSIIKRVATEQHLGETVGPKVKVVPKPKKEEKPKVAGAKPQTAETAVAGTLAGNRKVVKEIELATEAAKEQGRRKLLEGQNTVFKRADYLKREMVHSTRKKKGGMQRAALKTMITTPAEHKRIVEMGEKISVAEFAKQLGVKATQVIAKLMNLGVTATMNELIDLDTATLCAHEFKFEVNQKVFKEENFIPTVNLDAENLETRPPVVTIMGHVDHGKTSLLDAIRKTTVASGEAGGITQHIGAYMVEVKKGKISFLDTPGHEAFTAMRARGAKVTDIVVLVVSAIDGVMPQTLESINHAKAAGVPIIVAVNKIDLPDANPDRIKQTLAGHGLNPEEWGGDTIYASVSAKTGKGIDQLLESILLQAEMLELKANYNVPARGTVIESRLDKNRGPVATILVQHGKLKTGAMAVCGVAFGKIKAMTNYAGKRQDEATPSEPIELLGLPSVPNVGDDLFVVEDEKTARALTEARSGKQDQARVDATRPKMTLEEMMALANPGTEKELRVILKSDVQGSTEALKEAILKLPQDKTKIKMLHSGTGGITESDVMLATASRAVILGFNIRPDVKAQRLAEQEHVEVRTYNIIYDLLEDMKKLMEGLLDKIVKEKVIGRAEVRNVFNIPKVGTIAGSAVIDGKVTRGCFLRLLRDSRVIYEGKISSLKRFKEDVKEVAQGFECGIGVENFNDVKLGDQFEAFIKEESKGIL